MTRTQRCSGTNTHGEPCRSVILVDGEFCSAHTEGGLDHMRSIARKGAEKTNARWAEGKLKADEIPDLRTPQDAERLLELIARSIATNRIDHRSGDAVTRAVRAWLQAHSDGSVREKLEEMAATIAELKHGRQTEG